MFKKLIITLMILSSVGIYADIDINGDIESSSTVMASDLNFKLGQIESALTSKNLTPTSSFISYSSQDTLDKQELLDQFDKIPSEIDLGVLSSLSNEILSAELNSLFNNVVLAIDDHCIPSDVTNAVTVAGKISTGCIPLTCDPSFVVDGNSCVIGALSPLVAIDERPNGLSDIYGGVNSTIFDITSVGDKLYYQSWNGGKIFDESTGTLVPSPQINPFDTQGADMKYSFSSNGDLYTITETYDPNIFGFTNRWSVIRADGTTQGLLSVAFGSYPYGYPIDPSSGVADPLGFSFNNKPLILAHPSASFAPVGGPTNGVNLGDGFFTFNPTADPAVDEATYYVKTRLDDSVNTLYFDKGDRVNLFTKDSISDDHIFFRSRKRVAPDNHVSTFSNYFIDASGTLTEVGQRNALFHTICNNEYGVYITKDQGQNESPWLVDFTNGNNFMLADYQPSATNKSGIDEILRVDDKCVFQVADGNDPSASGPDGKVKIIKVDSKTGTLVTLDVETASNPNTTNKEQMDILFSLNEYLYYFKLDVFGHNKLTRVNVNTNVVETIGTPSSPGGSSDTVGNYLGNGFFIHVKLPSLSGRGYFVYNDDLWMVDTDDTFKLVQDLSPGADDKAYHFTEYNGYVYFASIKSELIGSYYTSSIYRMHPDGTNVEEVYQDVNIPRAQFNSSLGGYGGKNLFFIKTSSNLYFPAENAAGTGIKIHKLDPVTNAQTLP